MQVNTSVSILCGATYSVDGVECRIHKLLEKAAEKTPLKIALYQDDVVVTLAELNERAAAMAECLAPLLRRRSIHSGDDVIVAVCLLPGVDLIVTLLAIWKCGSAYLPVDASFPAERVTHILGDARPLLFITTHALLNTSPMAAGVRQSNVPVFDIDAIHQMKTSPTGLTGPTSVERTGGLAVVLYTSGSTGIPKGVRLEHSTIYQRLRWQWKTLPFLPGEVACFKTALTFVDSIAEIWAPLLASVPIYIVPKAVTQNAQQFLELLERLKITRLVLVPSLLKALLTYVSSRRRHATRDAPAGAVPLKHLKLWVCSGEILPADLLIQFYECFPQDTVICNFYGSTEVMGDVTAAIFKSLHDVRSSLVDNKVPIGKPLDNCAVYLLNGAKELVPLGDIGEMYVVGAHVASGYVNNREKDRFTANNIQPNRKGYERMFRTGDYGRIVGGQLVYEGRSDSQVKVRGHRVDLSEVYNNISQLPEVSVCVVLCYKPGEPEQELLAFIIPNRCTIESIKGLLSNKLVSYMMPRIVEIKELPLLVNGKVDRQLLLRHYDNLRHQTSSSVVWKESELNKEERALLKTVVSVIGQSAKRPIQLDDNFFDVGGNSLNAVSVVTKLQDQGFFIDMGAFLAASKLQEVVPSLTQNCASATNKESKYTIEMLSSTLREQVIRIICTSFSEKGELELLTNATYADYDVFINDIWEPLVAADLSFVVKNEKSEVMAVALNFDVFNEPAVETHVPSLTYIFEFLESIEAPVREKHFEKKTNHLIHSFMMATAETSTPAENVVLIQLMEQETIRVAKARGFNGVFTTNTNELTRQMCDDVLNYRVLYECQVNQYVAPDGSRPFAKAPDSQVSAVTVKYIN